MSFYGVAVIRPVSMVRLTRGPWDWRAIPRTIADYAEPVFYLTVLSLCVAHLT